MPTLLLLAFALYRTAILMAVALMVVVVLYLHHRNRVLELRTRELKGRLQDLQQIDTRKTEAFATTVHELRSPLTSIRGALVLLSAGAIGELDDRAANLVRIATGNTGRLVRLIDEILDLERMESGLVPLDLRPCALDLVLSQAVDAMSPMAQAAAIKIHPPEAPTAPLLFAGDASRMEQVICNLLSNAIKFSAPGSDINLTLRAEPGSLVLRVQDNGRGIPANRLEAVFHRFVRVDPPASAQNTPSPQGIRSLDGSGLGLAISRSLVAQHGGTLHAERNDSLQPGRPGTTFVLRLPRLLDQALPPDPPSASQDGPDSLSGTLAGLSLQKLHDNYARL